MSDQTAASPPVSTSSEVQARSKFFVGFAGVLLLVVLIGFSPTLYLRAFFDVPDMPTYVLVHGAILTVWFVWFFIQTSLVAVHRTHLHRRLGIIGVGIGVAVIVAGGMVSLGLVPRLSSLGRDVEANIAQHAVIVWGNLGQLIPFCVFLTLAIANRRKSEIHKRLMLLSSISIIGPALARVGRIPMLRVSESFVVNESVFAFGGLLMLLLALVVHDAVVNKRLHSVTMWGVPATLLSPAFFGLLVANTTFGRTLVLLLN